MELILIGLTTRSIRPANGSTRSYMRDGKGFVNCEKQMHSEIADLKTIRVWNYVNRPALYCPAPLATEFFGSLIE